MALGRCQGSSVDIQMVPRIIDSQSGQGDVVKRNGGLVRECLFTLSNIWLFDLKAEVYKDWILKFLLLCCSSVFIFMSTITFKLKSSGQNHDNPATLNKIERFYMNRSSGQDKDFCNPRRDSSPRWSLSKFFG